jgi:hypothetical protein
MSSTLIVQVELQFSQPVANVQAVVENVGRALENEIFSNVGIAPDDEEAVTERVRVTCGEHRDELVVYPYVRVQEIKETDHAQLHDLMG